MKIVTDLFIGALDNRYDTAIVISSDTDMVPAIDTIRHRFKKKIEYVGFSLQSAKDESDVSKPIYAMIKHTDIARTLVDADLRPFIIPKLVS